VSIGNVTDVTGKRSNSIYRFQRSRKSSVLLLLTYIEDAGITLLRSWLLFTSKYGVIPLEMGTFTSTSLTAGADEAKYFDYGKAFHKHENNMTMYIQT